MRTALFALGCCGLVAACTTQPMKPSDAHLRQEPAAAGAIPAPVMQVPPVPVPRPSPKLELYSVSVVNVPVQDVLFALARDAKLNIDIHPGIAGNVTLNAIDQTLPQILSRIARQSDMRYEVNGQNMVVMPDTPFLRHYKVDYINMGRDTSGEVSISASISGSSTSGSGGATVVNAFGGANTSSTKITNATKNRFWETLVQNVKDLLRETDKIIVESATEVAGARTGAPPAGAAPGGAAPGQAPQQGAPGQAPAATESMAGASARRVSFREAASVIANPETGIITVRATARQHEKVQEFLEAVGASAKRQVLIEATIVEVQLSDSYQQGIDWSVIWRGAGLTFELPGNLTNTPPGRFQVPSGGNPNFGILRHIGGGIDVTLKLLESFGTTRVLSSPKLSVLNNQTAILKVVRNEVYFTITAGTTNTGGTVATSTDPTATPNTVPIGLIMSVTPQISDSSSVMLNVRPTISRQVGSARDPTPNLPIPNLIPIVQVNEMESLIQVESGQIAVMGGLMQDQIIHADDTLPGIGRIPVLGEAFTWRNDTKQKIELVIFLRPIVVKNASLEGDYAGYRQQLPDSSFVTPAFLGPNFFKSPEEATRPGPPFEGN